MIGSEAIVPGIILYYRWLGEGPKLIQTTLRLTRDIHNFSSQDDRCLAGKDCHCPGTRHMFTNDEVLACGKFMDDSEGCSFRGIKELFYLHSKGLSSDSLGIPIDLDTAHSAQFFSTFFEHPWFARVWVLQEALLARVALVHCGGETIPWKEVLAMNRWVGDQRYMIVPHLNKPTYMPLIWSTLMESKQNWQRGIDQTFGSPVTSILEIFLDALDLKSTQPQDKLFALLSFTREGRNAISHNGLIQANYEKSVAEVFADFTRWCILEHRDLCVLSAIHAHKSRSWVRRTWLPLADWSDNPTCSLSVDTEKFGDAPSIPTWAINNMGSSKLARRTLEAQFSFRATGETVPDEELLSSTSDPMILKLRGFRLDHITVISQAPIKELYPYGSNYQHFFSGRDDIIGVFDRMFDPTCFLLWGELYFDTFKEVPGDALNPEKAREKLRNHIRTHRDYCPGEAIKVLKMTETRSDEPEYYETMETLTCLDRCFFRTSNGSFGLCPWTAREGDIITLHLGARVPYLLRPVRAYPHCPEQDVGNACASTYRLVGECYLNGYMNGEILENRHVSDTQTSVFDII